MTWKCRSGLILKENEIITIPRRCNNCLTKAKAGVEKLEAREKRMAERDTVRACLQYLALKNIVTWRSNNTGIYNAQRGCHIFHGTKGVPDIIGVLPGGRFLGVECKSAKGRQSPAQKEMQQRIESAGGLYVLARGIDDLEAALKGS